MSEFDEMLAWGDNGEWIVIGGHVDRAVFFGEAGLIAEDYGFDLEDFSLEDVLHAYATPRSRPGHGEWCDFHTANPEPESVPITVLALDGEDLPADPTPDRVVESDALLDAVPPSPVDGLADRLISKTVHGDLA